LITLYIVEWLSLQKSLLLIKPSISANAEGLFI